MGRNTSVKNEFLNVLKNREVHKVNREKIIERIDELTAQVPRMTKANRVRVRKDIDIERRKLRPQPVTIDLENKQLYQSNLKKAEALVKASIPNQKRSRGRPAKYAKLEKELDKYNSEFISTSVDLLLEAYAGYSLESSHIDESTLGKTKRGRKSKKLVPKVYKVLQELSESNPAELKRISEMQRHDYLNNTYLTIRATEVRLEEKNEDGKTKYIVKYESQKISFVPKFSVFADTLGVKNNEVKIVISDNAKSNSGFEKITFEYIDGLARIFELKHGGKLKKRITRKDIFSKKHFRDQIKAYLIQGIEEFLEAKKVSAGDYRIVCRKASLTSIGGDIYTSFEELRVFSSGIDSNYYFKDITDHSYYWDDMCLFENFAILTGEIDNFYEKNKIKEENRFQFITTKHKSKWLKYLLEKFDSYEDDVKDVFYSGKIKEVVDFLRDEMNVNVRIFDKKLNAMYPEVDMEKVDEKTHIIFTVGEHCVLSNTRKIVKWLKMNNGIEEVGKELNESECIISMKPGKYVIDNSAQPVIMRGLEAKREDEKKKGEDKKSKYDKRSIEEKLEKCYIVCFDIEAYQDNEKQKQIQFLLCATIQTFSSNGEARKLIKKTFTGPNCGKDFTKWIEKDIKMNVTNEEIYFFAHNGGKYDQLVIMQDIVEQFGFPEIRGELNDIKMMTTKIEDKYRVSWLDTCKIFPSSLKEIGTHFLKLHNNENKMEFDVTSITKDNWQREVRKGKVVEYCERDVEVLNMFVEKWIRTIDSFGVLKTIYPTANSLARAVAEIQEPNLRLKASKRYIQEIERLSQKGAYVDVFQRIYYPDFDVSTLNGDKPVISWDMHASYWKAMLGEMPIEAEFIEVYEDTKGIKMQFDDCDIYFVDGFKFMEGEMYPSIPFVKDGRTKNALSFDGNGERLLFIHGVVLRHLQKANRLQSLKVKGRIHYISGKIFERTINYLWGVRLREGKDTPMGLVAKLIGNSLFGGFGRRNYGKSYFTDRRDIVQREAFGCNEKITSIEDTPFGDTVYVNEYNPSFYLHDVGTLVRLSSYIMAEARTRLFKFIHHLPVLKVLYCDTDSVTVINDGSYVIDPSFLDADPSMPEIGKFGVEKKGDYHLAAAPKMRIIGNYDGKNKLSTKGIPKAIRDELCTEEWFNEVITSENGVRVTSSSGENIKTVFRRSQTFVNVMSIPMTITSRINKRILNTLTHITYPYP